MVASNFNSKWCFWYISWNMTTIYSLPVEILIIIFGKCDLISLLNLRQVKTKILFAIFRTFIFSFYFIRNNETKLPFHFYVIYVLIFIFNNIIWICNDSSYMISIIIKFFFRYLFYSKFWWNMYYRSESNLILLLNIFEFMRVLLWVMKKRVKLSLTN